MRKSFSSNPLWQAWPRQRRLVAGESEPPEQRAMMLLQELNLVAVCNLNGLFITADAIHE